MSDPDTLATYAKMANEYAALNRLPGASSDLLAFVTAVPAGGRVLDLGCGPGQEAALMQEAGLTVTALDAVPEMVALAQKAGVPAQLGRFEDLPLSPPFDGIWASFSLLHASRDAFPKHLAAIHASLVPGGAFYIGMKLGDGAEIDSLNRSYTYYTEAQLLDLLRDAGFTILGHRTGRSKGLSGVVAPHITVQTHA